MSEAGFLMMLWTVLVGAGVICLGVIRRAQLRFADRNRPMIQQFEESLGPVTSVSQVRLDQERIKNLMARMGIGAVEMSLHDGNYIHLRLVGGRLRIDR